MSAYVISDVWTLDQAAMARYRQFAAESIAKYGGRYLVRAGAVETLESDWHPEAIIVVPRYKSALDFGAWDQGLSTDLCPVHLYFDDN